MFHRNLKISFAVILLMCAAACRQPSDNGNITVAANSLRDVPSVKMNFRFETDVPAPPDTNKQNLAEEKNAAVQADFDQTRTAEVLEKTFTSPNKQRILAVYRKPSDLANEYRLDMYGADGKLLKKITPNGLAVHFPDTIVWSPDGNNVAFVGVIRLLAPASPETLPTPSDVNSNTAIDGNTNANVSATADANVNTANTNIETANAAANANAAPPAEPQSNVLTFRTEQIYTCNSEGTDLKLLTQNEGLMYFYFIWSPDSSTIAALASTWKEWQFGQNQATLKGEVFVPSGRPRLVEKTGRERRLDDAPTTVQPVWSPDSAKVALAFDKEVRIYDAIGDAPTQAAIPLRNPLLISSKKFDEDLEKQEQSQASNSNSNANANSNANVKAGTNANVNAAPTPALPQDVNVLPDENTLVSFNPVIRLEWTEDKMLYVQTGYVKEMTDSSASARSYLRWHRLLFSPQPIKVN